MKRTRRIPFTEALCLATFFAFAFAGCQVKNDRPIVVPRTEGHREGYVQELREKMKQAQGELDRVEAERFKLIQSAESSAAKRRDPKHLARLKELETVRRAKRSELDRFRSELEAENVRLGGKEAYVEYGKYFPSTSGAVFDFRDFRLEVRGDGSYVARDRRGGAADFRLDPKGPPSVAFSANGARFRLEAKGPQIAIYSEN
ncbi:MAG: hypothetical protein JST04_08420 [Bdellovibrionales bacterium]|nr:hypothetical protein [Bdellovibrionales bacterium]